MDGHSAPHGRAATGPVELIGREMEIQRLRLFVGRVTEGAGETLLLSGDAGVGKTSLLDHATAIAADCGIRLLRATGSQFEADISFAALHQLLQPCSAELSHLSPLHARALNVALYLGEGPPPPPLLVAGAVLALLRQQAAQERPLLLIVDDLPWLDHASALVLGMVARRLTGLPAGLLAACRTGQAGFFDQGDLTVMHVEPLSEEAAAELLTTRYPVMTPRVRRRLLETALGNPLALLELPVSLGDLTHTAAGTIPAALPLSRRLQTVFASRIQALPTSTYELLLPAVLDGTGDLRLIRALAADREGPGLEPAERAGLVHADESAERLTFRHPLIRSTVVELSTSRQRRRAHAELAARLADRPERHAWHLAEATEEPDERVAALLQEVAHTNLRRGDSVGAVTELLRAAELSPSGKGRSGRLAEAAYLGSIVTGDLRDAPRLLEQARRADPGPRGPLSTAVAGAYQLLHADGDVDTAHRLLTTAIHHLDDPRDAHDKVLIEALYTLLMICFFGGRADLWPSLRTTVDRLTPRPPELLAILSATFSDPARLTPAMLARADASVADLGRQVSPARIIRTGIAVSYLDRLSDCREPLQRAIQHGREGGAVTSAIEALFLLAQDAFHTGRWDEARQLTDEGLQLCDTHGYHLLAWPGRLTAALLAAACGDSRTTTRIARHMDAWAAPRRAGIVAAYAAHIRSLTALGRADFETAFHNAAAISPPGTLAPYAPQALWVFLDLVEAAIHTNRRTEAAAHVAAARDCRLDRLSPRLRLVVLACTAITEPRPDIAALEQAITEPGSERWPFDLARIRLTYGSHLRRTKRTTDARRQLAAAAETFHRLGATPWAARADGELRATGITVSTPSTGLASLTPQQRQIALLAAAGHTNKEIAARLFLSPRTVSTHLYQVFPKLGITSRAALRDALADPPDSE
ncbi:AAA family ATPase [Actinoallomurus sp. NPDC052308]|uniref:ATP-binding protein n=1 Tax=Actinoallomurus sp. NPDC052308 TaxID=3155530 RepID=UPI0034400E5D